MKTTLKKISRMFKDLWALQKPTNELQSSYEKARETFSHTQKEYLQAGQVLKRTLQTSSAQQGEEQADAQVREANVHYLQSKEAYIKAQEAFVQAKEAYIQVYGDHPNSSKAFLHAREAYQHSREVYLGTSEASYGVKTVKSSGARLFRQLFYSHNELENSEREALIDKAYENYQRAKKAYLEYPEALSEVEETYCRCREAYLNYPKTWKSFLANYKATSHEEAQQTFLDLLESIKRVQKEYLEIRVIYQEVGLFPLGTLLDFCLTDRLNYLQSLGFLEADNVETKIVAFLSSNHSQCDVLSTLCLSLRLDAYNKAVDTASCAISVLYQRVFFYLESLQDHTLKSLFVKRVSGWHFPRKKCKFIYFVGAVFRLGEEGFRAALDETQFYCVASKLRASPRALFARCKSDVYLKKRFTGLSFGPSG